MNILRNSAKCTACGKQVVSSHVHDFNPHYCKADTTPGTYRFAVDGGNDYLRRVGEGYVETSLLVKEKTN